MEASSLTGSAFQSFSAERVRLIVDCLMGMYDNEELRHVLLPKFLHDLLVGLMALSFAPQSQGELRTRYQARLRRVTTCGSPPRRDIVREVFVIQGARSQTVSSSVQKLFFSILLVIFKQ